VSADRRAIHDAYRRTSYRATLDGGSRVEIRIGEICAALDAELRARGAVRWAFVTASNPHAEALSDSENAARHAELIHALAGYPCFEGEGEGAGDDPNWAPERSLLALGISEEEASRIARCFGQEAIVVGAPGQPARLVFCGKAP
jgi:hypothetical protein